MTTLSTLTPLWRHPSRTMSGNPENLSRDPARVAPASAAPAPAAAVVQPTRVDVEHLTAADVRDLSFATIGLLTPINPKLVADLIINAGKMRRAELPMNTFAMRPLARCILLAGEKRRGRELCDADAQFLADYLDEIGAR